MEQWRWYESLLTNYQIILLSFYLLILGSDASIADLVGNYISEIEKLKAKLIESEQMFQQLKKSTANPPRNMLKQSNSYMECKELHKLQFICSSNIKS